VKSSFIHEVQARIQNTAFQLPQVYSEFEGGFCNEEVYGHCNFIEVTGAVRLVAPPPGASRSSE
jgi:hypothetical protein